MPDETTASEAPRPLKPPAEVVARIRAAFMRVLDAAVPAYEVGQLNLFHDEDEKFIRDEVDRKLYEPQLPNGGQKERRMIERLKKLAEEKDWSTSRWKMSPRSAARARRPPGSAATSRSRGSPTIRMPTESSSSSRSSERGSTSSPLRKGGDRYRLRGHKELEVLNLVDSFTLVRASLYDPDARGIGRATLRFDARGNWRSLVRSFRLTW